MILFTDLHEIPPLDRSCGLTIGSFDGVHLGHQALLKHLRAKLPADNALAVYTFSNHPSHFFSSHAPTPLICSPLQKAKLLAQYGADIVILTPFTDAFSKVPYDQFLRLLKQKLSFTHLVLGTHATFGMNKEGNETQVRELAKTLDFDVEYLPKTVLHKEPISSRRVRALIAKAAFHEVEQCLGRPYSLLGHLEVVEQGYVLFAKGLCLPPEGIYPVRILDAQQNKLARAHVLPREQKICIEFLQRTDLKNQEVELVF